MPLGAFPPHLVPHMTQMMQNSKYETMKNSFLLFVYLFDYLAFPGFGSIPPPPHLLRLMMPPFLGPLGLTGGKSLETLQADLKKV